MTDSRVGARVADQRRRSSGAPPALVFWHPQGAWALRRPRSLVPPSEAKPSDVTQGPPRPSGPTGLVPPSEAKPSEVTVGFDRVKIRVVQSLARQMAERRQRILAAAREIIAGRGYEALTMRELARASRVTVPTLYNLIGGKQAVLGRRLIKIPGATEFTTATQTNPNWAAGLEVRLENGGGGGWGDPLDREPARVLSDVVEEYVSAESAKADYGVVLAAGGTKVDDAATGMLRAEMRNP